MTHRIGSFFADAGWLQQALSDMGYRELAATVVDSDCWPSLAPKFKSWPEDVKVALREALLNYGCAEDHASYLIHIDGGDDAVFAALRESGDNAELVNYCRCRGRNEAIEDAIIKNDLNADNSAGAVRFCVCVARSDAMRQSVLDVGDADSIFDYINDVNDSADADGVDPDMKQALIDSGSYYNCFRYCRRYGDDDAMCDVVIKGDDPALLLSYCRYIADREDVWRRLIECGDLFRLRLYVSGVRSDNADVNAAITKLEGSTPEPDNA